MTFRQPSSRPRWVLSFLAAIVAVATIIGLAAASSAATTVTAQTRVGASAEPATVLVGPPKHISAGQRLGNDPARVVHAVATGVAANPAIGFAEGLGKTALTPGRLQHATKNLTKAGVLPAWSGKNSPGIIERAFVPILERPTATFEHTLGGTRVRGFLGDIDGNQVALFVYKEGPYQGQLASSFVPSANQLKMWGVP